MVKKIVVKVGTSTLTYKNGKANIGTMEKLARVLSDIQNSGIQVVLVSSGAIGMGVQKMGLSKKPDTVEGRQAAASIGQTELMFMYDKLFGEYNQNLAQLLLTKDDIFNEERREHLINTFNELFSYCVIPVVNENDCVTVDEIKFGDNDTLSALTAKIIGADMLIMLTDIDGLYNKNPQIHSDAQQISYVERFSEELYKGAGEKGSALGTGGMITKLQAAEIATAAHADVVIMNGKNPGDIYKVLNGEEVGTFFKRA